MKFTVTKTSDYLGSKQPCENSYKEGKEWVIEIESLDDLMLFISENEYEVVINSPEMLYCEAKYPQIKICDS